MSLTVNIHLYLNENTEQTAYENIRRIKEEGFHITATSPRPLPERFYDYVDVFLHDKENQLLSQVNGSPEPTVYYTTQAWFKMNFFRHEIQRHGLAVLRSMTKGCQLAEMNGFDRVLRIEFDDLLSPDALQKCLTISNVMPEEMLVFKNDYGYKQNLSVHTILYTPSSFLRVFGHIKNETDYLTSISDAGFEGYTILEELMLRMIEQSDAEVLYMDGTKMNEFFTDSYFNVHQSPANLISGCLIDIMHSGDSLFLGFWCVDPPGGKFTVSTTTVEGTKHQEVEVYTRCWNYSGISNDVTLVEVLLGGEVVYRSEPDHSVPYSQQYNSYIEFK